MIIFLFRSPYKESLVFPGIDAETGFAAVPAMRR